jgi:hypothetical protein
VLLPSATALQVYCRKYVQYTQTNRKLAPALLNIGVSISEHMFHWLMGNLKKTRNNDYDPLRNFCGDVGENCETQNLNEQVFGISFKRSVEWRTLCPGINLLGVNDGPACVWFLRFRGHPLCS